MENTANESSDPFHVWNVIFSLSACVYFSGRTEHDIPVTIVLPFSQAGAQSIEAEQVLVRLNQWLCVLPVGFSDVMKGISTTEGKGFVLCCDLPIAVITRHGMVDSCGWSSMSLPHFASICSH